MVRTVGVEPTWADARWFLRPVPMPIRLRAHEDGTRDGSRTHIEENLAASEAAA